MNDPALNPQPEYDARWTTGLGSSPWRGLFAESASIVRLYNLFNSNDQAFALSILPTFVTTPWQFAQKFTKLHHNLIGNGDNRYELYWANLQWTSEDAEELWSVKEPDQHHAALTRRWAELAFWFQPLSGTAGRQRTGAIAEGQEIDTYYLGGGDGGFPSFLSHTYPTSRRTWEVWPLWKTCREIFANQE